MEPSFDDIFSEFQRQGRIVDLTDKEDQKSGDLVCDASLREGGELIADLIVSGAKLYSGNPAFRGTGFDELVQFFLMEVQGLNGNSPVNPITIRTDPATGATVIESPLDVPLVCFSLASAAYNRFVLSRHEPQSTTENSRN